MIQQKHRGLDSKLYNSFLCSAAVLMLISCETTRTTIGTANMGVAPSSNSMHSTPNQNEPASVNISQISSLDTTLNARQIGSPTNSDQLTVNQLRTYADRCSPTATQPPPQGLDCSELNLRVKRLFRSDDKISDALILLDRLGRNDNIDNVSEDLEDGLPGRSLNSQAIAGGLLDSSPAPPPPDPKENIEDYLNQNGLTINAGAIIQNSQ